MSLLEREKSAIVLERGRWDSGGGKTKGDFVRKASIESSMVSNCSGCSPFVEVGAMVPCARSSDTMEG